MRQIGSDSPRQTIFLLVGRIPCLLGLSGCKLPQCGERDLAAAVFDALAPNMGEPYVLPARIAFQRFVGFRTILFTEVVGEDLHPIRTIPTIVSRAAGRHKMQIRPVCLPGQPFHHLAFQQRILASGDHRNIDQ